MQINKDIGNVEEGIRMIENLLSEYKDDLPKGKLISDFGGGYVEILKTKANVVFYFGFDESKNRVSFKLEIERDEVLLWLEAMAETVWTKQARRVKFGDKSKFKTKKPKPRNDNCDVCYDEIDGSGCSCGKY